MLLYTRAKLSEQKPRLEPSPAIKQQQEQEKIKQQEQAKETEL